jgi:hypothetical protein
MEKEANNTSPMVAIWLMQALPDFFSDMMYFPQDCRTEYALGCGNFLRLNLARRTLNVLQSLLFSRAGSESTILNLVVPANGKEDPLPKDVPLLGSVTLIVYRSWRKHCKGFKKAAVGSVVHRSLCIIFQLTDERVYPADRISAKSIVTAARLPQKNPNPQIPARPCYSGMRSFCGI